MKNKQNWIPIIGIASLVLCLVSGVSTRALNALSGPEMMMSGNPYVPDLPEITSDTQPMTLDEIARRFKRTFDEGMPGQYSAEMDEAAGTYTVTTWSDGMNANVPNAALRSLDQKKKWDADLEQMRALCAQMQDLVNAHGHPELDVVLRLVNCDDLDQLFAAARRGVLIYDIVESTPPGELIEGAA